MSPENNKEQNFDVFISYSSKEKAIADAVVAAHEQAGIRCWYAPRDIGPGADWAEAITKAIHDCSLMVLIFSKEANRSQRVIDEVNYAISQEKALLPFRVESANPTGALSLHLSSRHWLDAYESGWETHIDRLVNSVRINLENVIEAVQISGGEAPAKLGGIAPGVGAKRNPLKTAAYLVAGLILVSVVGYLGWQNIGPGSSPSPTEVIAAEELSIQPEVGETATPTPGPRFPAVLNNALVEVEPVLSLDPQIALPESLALTQNLFMGLTRFNPQIAEVVPAAASSWTISPDGTIYTFTIPEDIPWVQHSLGGETVQVVDDDGNPRYVTAEDFEFGIKRLCDPRTNAYFGEFLGNIAGCSESWDHPDPENFPAEMLDQIEVEPVSDTELIIHLVEPSASFLTKTSSPFLVAVPSWTLEKYGEAWTNPGILQTYGPFVIDEYTSGESFSLIRNQLLPDELHGEGNISRIDTVIVESNEEGYQLWVNEKLDYIKLSPEIQNIHLENYPQETKEYNLPLVNYAIFNLQDPLFADVHIRRALSAALDRSRLLSEIFEIGGIPMKHLAPPGVFGALPENEVGVGYNPDYAQDELTQAGYPGCLGFPQVNLYAYSQIAHANGEETARFWEAALNCPEGTFLYKGSIREFWLNPGSFDDWDVIISGWASDFADQEDWVGTILNCEADWNFGSTRVCNEIDDLIELARVETTPTDRKELYLQIEEAFFGDEGTFPIAPLYTPIQYYAARSWVDMGIPVSTEGFDLANSNLDMDAKEAALGE